MGARLFAFWESQFSSSPHARAAFRNSEIALFEYSTRARGFTNFCYGAFRVLNTRARLFAILKLRFSSTRCGRAAFRTFFRPKQARNHTCFLTLMKSHIWESTSVCLGLKTLFNGITAALNMFLKPREAHSRSDLRAELYAQIEDHYGPRRSSNLFLTDRDLLFDI